MGGSTHLSRRAESACPAGKCADTQRGRAALMGRRGRRPLRTVFAALYGGTMWVSPPTKSQGYVHTGRAESSAPTELSNPLAETGRQKAAWHKKTHGFACVYPAEIGRKSAHMRQHAGVFAANFSSNLLWQNCFAPKKCAFCAEPRRVAADILDVCHGGATTGLRQTRLLRRTFSYARRPNAVPSEFIAPRSFSAAPHRRCSAHTGSHPPR